MKLKKILPIFLLCGLILIPAVPAAVSYMTDQPDDMLNPFTIAMDSTTTVVEKFPDPGEPEGTIQSFEKAVQIANTGYIDCYTRVALTFSEDDIKNKTKYSYDGTNYYTQEEYINHLPSGWVYNKDDGYFYYTPILEASWNEIENKFVYDKQWGEHFYPEGENVMVSHAAITTPLIRYVKTEFDSPEDMRTYSLHVYSESVPFYFGTDYASAWRNYLNGMGS